VRAGRGQVNVTHAFTTHFGLRDFNTAFFANDTAMLQALVLTAEAFVILDWTKNLGAKETISLWLEGAVIDGFGLFDFAKGPRADFLRRCHANGDGIEMLIGRELLEQVE
jgi:hypothetical protein